MYVTPGVKPKPVNVAEVPAAAALVVVPSVPVPTTRYETGNESTGLPEVQATVTPVDVLFTHTVPGALGALPAPPTADCVDPTALIAET